MGIYPIPGTMITSPGMRKETPVEALDCPSQHLLW